MRLSKRGITSYDALALVARALDRRPGDLGMAGVKDRWAVAEQWISVPGVDPEAVLDLDLPRVRILEAERHPHKLRTGHLAGNLFAIRLVGVGVDAVRLATATLSWLASRGAYNYFGPQRFGSVGDNAERGRELLAGRLRVRDRRRRRLLLSALQSELFNAYLALRQDLLSDVGLERPVAGELVQKTDTGGIFEVEDVEEVAGRMARGEVVLTGPLFGPKMRRPPASSCVRELEERVLSEAGLDLAQLARYKRLAPGARRPLVLRPRRVGAAATKGGIEVRFELNPGGYATVVLREVTKTPFARLRPGPLASPKQMA